MQNQVSPELRRNTDDKMFFGVASGLADYFGLDVAILRVLFVVTAFLTGGTTLLIYLLLAILVPEQEPTNSGHTGSATSTAQSESDNPAALPDPGPRSPGRTSSHTYRTSSDQQLVERRRNLAGWIVIVLGVVLLATNVGFFSWLSFGRFWPLLLIAIGIAMILGLFRRQEHSD